MERLFLSEVGLNQQSNGLTLFKSFAIVAMVAWVLFLGILVMFANPYAPLPSEKYLDRKVANFTTLKLEVQKQFVADGLTFNTALQTETFDAEHGDEKLILLHEIGVNLDHQADVIAHITQEASILNAEWQTLKAGTNNTYAQRRALLADIRQAEARNNQHLVELHTLQHTFKKKLKKLNAFASATPS